MVLASHLFSVIQIAMLHLNTTCSMPERVQPGYSKNAFHLSSSNNRCRASDIPQSRQCLEAKKPAGGDDDDVVAVRL